MFVLYDKVENLTNCFGKEPKWNTERKLKSLKSLILKTPEFPFLFFVLFKVSLPISLTVCKLKIIKLTIIYFEFCKIQHNRS